LCDPSEAVPLVLHHLRSTIYDVQVVAYEVSSHLHKSLGDDRLWSYLLPEDASYITQLQPQLSRFIKQGPSSLSQNKKPELQHEEQPTHSSPTQQSHSTPKRMPNMCNKLPKTPNYATATPSLPSRHRSFMDELKEDKLQEQLDLWTPHLHP